MKKTLTILSAFAFASASESSDNELRLRPVSYNPNEDLPLEDFLQTFPRKFPRDLPPILYADDDELRIRSIDFVPEEFLLNGFPEDNEQFARFNLVQNWHYPLKPIQTTQPYVPIPVENLAKTEEELAAENLLFQLGQLIKQGVEIKKREQGTVTKPRMRPESRVFMPPSSVKKERQEQRK